MTYYGEKTEDVHSGTQISIRAVAKADRVRIHAAVLATALPEVVEWISRLNTMPEPYLAARPTASWRWDGIELRRDL